MTQRPTNSRYLRTLSDRKPYGTIMLCGGLRRAAPSFISSTLLLSWHTYSNISAPGFHLRLKPPFHGFVYAPGSSSVLTSKPRTGCANTGATPIVIAIAIVAVNFMCAALGGICEPPRAHRPRCRAQTRVTPRVLGRAHEGRLMPPC